MARIILESYLIRYPMGGMLSWMLPWLSGFRQLGHDVYFVERCGYDEACFDPEQGVMSNDPGCGLSRVVPFFREHGLGNQWCFVDWEGEYYGLSKSEIEHRFKTGDLYVDMGGLGSWREEAEQCEVTVLLDLDPTFTQIERVKQQEDPGQSPVPYDHYYTVGKEVASGEASTPSDGTDWKGIYNPVCMDQYRPSPPEPNRPFTTVMNWQSYDPIQYKGVTYGNKDREFPKFRDLPQMVSGRVQLAVSGLTAPQEKLTDAGWELRDAQKVTRTYESFRDYLEGSIGEFSVCNHAYVEPLTGWFSDRSATYLAMGRPVVLQDTGFSRHLPCGEGLFAVEDSSQAAEAMDIVRSNPFYHSKQARAIARAHLDATEVLDSFLGQVDVG